LVVVGCQILPRSAFRSVVDILGMMQQLGVIPDDALGAVAQGAQSA
jgi:hypothetical protein